MDCSGGKRATIGVAVERAKIWLDLACLNLVAGLMSGTIDYEMTVLSQPGLE